MTVLVTGPAGFAGSHLVELLRLNGEEVRPFRGDIRDRRSCQVQTQGIEKVYHLAAISIYDYSLANPLETWDTNVTGTLNCLKAARDNGVKRFLFTSSSHVYGNSRDFPQTEETRPFPMEVYSVSKYASEMLCKVYLNQYKMETVVTRAFNHYGPRQRKEFLVPNLIHSILTTGEATMRDPNLIRDLTYVNDIVQGYVDVMEKGEPGEVYQLCSGNNLSLKQIGETIVKTVGHGRVSFEKPARVTDISRIDGSYAKAEKMLGWKPRVSFDEGVRLTVDWLKAKIA